MDTAESHRVGNLILKIIGAQPDLRVSKRRFGDAWELTASSVVTDEHWFVRSANIYEGACQLAEEVGFDLDE